MSKVPGTLALRSRARIWPGTIPGSHEPGFEEQPLVEHEPPEELRSVVLTGAIELHTLTMGDCRIILTQKDEGMGMRWCLSISCAERHPTWDEIKTARYRLLGPDLVMAMVLPRADDYVNEHPHVFQLWQLLEETEW